MASLFSDISGATFSPCGAYRYRLWRRWSDGPTIMYCGLNPSTADATEDDPTVKRCIARARDLGYGGMYMMNLFAFRATDPQIMKMSDDPVGPDNDRNLVDVAMECETRIACWGVHGSFRDRAIQVMDIVHCEWKCLGVTKGGYPRHPLYCPYYQKFVPYER